MLTMYPMHIGVPTDAPESQFGIITTLIFSSFNSFAIFASFHEAIKTPSDIIEMMVDNIAEIE